MEERWTSDPTVAGSSPAAIVPFACLARLGAPSGSASAPTMPALRMPQHCGHSLVVRTPRCGRGNPGSIPGDRFCMYSDHGGASSVALARLAQSVARGSHNPKVVSSILAPRRLLRRHLHLARISQGYPNRWDPTGRGYGAPARCHNGGVAQMVERSLSMREVQGSIPCISIF
jgi:hypothetical protein